MFTTQRINKTAKPAVISLMVGIAVACAAPMAGAGFSGAASSMQSTGPCLFSEQLQKSVSIRRQYLVKLSEALGKTVPASNAIEDMYSNITPASYRTDESDQSEAEVDVWGLGTREKLSTDVIDSLSSSCLGCHDGAAAISITADVRNNPYTRSHSKSSGSDHPIGMDYNRYVGAGRGFKAIPEGSNKMVFVDGKVGCLTCHNPMDPEKGRLVMSDSKSALCLTCHDR